MSLSRRSEQKWEECGSRAPLQHSSQHTHAQAHTCVHMRTRTHTRPPRHALRLSGTGVGTMQVMPRWMALRYSRPC